VAQNSIPLCLLFVSCLVNKRCCVFLLLLALKCFSTNGIEVDCWALFQSELSAASRSRLLLRDSCANRNLIEYADCLSGLGFYGTPKLTRRLLVAGTSGSSYPCLFFTRALRFVGHPCESVDGFR